MFLQRTIKRKAEVVGIGLHTGETARLTFSPAPENTGIYFVRRDLPGRPAISTSAHLVKATILATTLGGDTFSVSTVEHCLSTLAALRIDNLFIELDGPEIPIGDGSAKPFMDWSLRLRLKKAQQKKVMVLNIIRSMKYALNATSECL